MSSQYLIIKRMKVCHANANPAWWIVGPPALSAYAGLVGAVEFLASSLSGDPVSSTGFSVIHHDIDIEGEVFKDSFSPNQFRGANLINSNDHSNKASGPTLATQPTATCNLTVSLVIRFEEDIGISKKAVETLIETARLRLAGGRIDSAHVCIAKTIEEATAHFKTGFSIVDRKDLIADFIKSPKPHRDGLQASNVEDLGSQSDEGEVDVLDAALHYLHPYRNAEFPWMSATTVGFAHISELETRVGSRDGLPHAFVEPIVGLVQYKPVREIGLVFWKWIHPRKDVCVLSA